MQIVFEDNHVIVAVKPGGVLTQGDEGFEGSLKQFIKKRDNKPGNVFLHAIHRLDKPVSGLVLFAKTSKALSRLQQAMREHKIARKYKAEIEGELNGEGTWNFHHKKGPFRAEISDRPVPESKPISMHYKADGNQVEITLETGKYHQIRAVLGHLGVPIIGDHKYGGTERSSAIALSCVYIEFPHPITKETVACSF